MVGRNDDYGGDFRSRLQLCVIRLADQLNRMQVQAEIVFVNYNPITAGEPIETFIKWPRSTENVKVKVVTVPNEVHADLTSAGQRKPVPVLEYIAKNVGIRRASGEFIVSMNPDILFLDETIEQLASTSLDLRTYYRADRVDYRIGESSEDPTWEKVYNGSICCYLIGFRYPMKGYSPLKLVALRAFNRFRLFFHLKFIHWFKPVFALVGWKPNPHNAEYHFHCNVSGDFIMMHRTIWHQLKGNPERSYVALHTDAKMVVMAGVSGLAEVVLPQPIFHRDHQRRFDASEKHNAELREVYLKFQSDAQEMMRSGDIRIDNDDHWGLSELKLPMLDL